MINKPKFTIHKFTKSIKCSQLNVQTKHRGMRMYPSTEIKQHTHCCLVGRRQMNC